VYISKIELSDVRCFEKVNIELGDKGSSLLIAGNNGNGKSAILRSLSMGLCDQASAGSLLRELLGDFIRKEVGKDKREATITIDLFDETVQENFQIKTRIITNKNLGFEVVKQDLFKGSVKKEQHEFPWSKIFVAGYGAGLRTEGTQDYGQYFAADAVYSLFKYSHEMQNPELIWRRLLEVARDYVEDQSKETIKKIEDTVDKEIKKLLLNILSLNPESSSDNVSLENNGIYITSDWGKQELSALGDGYRGLTTMVMDILSWQLLMKNNKTILTELEENKHGEWLPLDLKKDCTGIVIIDEIEKHLHPKLQRFVVKKLKKVFPKIQFIISSHSPLCVAGTSDAEEEFVVYRALTENKINKVDKWKGGLSGLRTDQILEHFFQIPYINENTLSDIEDYSFLYLKGVDNHDSDDKKSFALLTERLNKNSKSIFLELESKLLDSIIKRQSDKIEKMIEDNND
jgi:predicted ATPase